MGWKNHPRTVLLALLATHVLAHIDRNMLLGFAPEITCTRSPFLMLAMVKSPPVRARRSS